MSVRFSSAGIDRDFMQNNEMTTPSEKFKAAGKKAVTQDLLLDPLPVPETKESSTDSVWGLWEHTLRAQEEAAKAGPETDFQDTLRVEDADRRDKP